LVADAGPAGLDEGDVVVIERDGEVSWYRVETRRGGFTSFVPCEEPVEYRPAFYLDDGYLADALADADALLSGATIPSDRIVKRMAEAVFVIVGAVRHAERAVNGELRDARWIREWYDGLRGDVPVVGSALHGWKWTVTLDGLDPDNSGGVTPPTIDERSG
jgi:hypothetical protein